MKTRPHIGSCSKMAFSSVQWIQQLGLRLQLSGLRMRLGQLRENKFGGLRGILRHAVS
jgi:hypothetical protein